MNIVGKLLFIGALFGSTICHSQQDRRPTSDDFRRAGMASIINTVAIAGDPKAVFDLITTARFWPLWHPASMVVGGVTERPYGLDDRIRERGQIGTQAFEVTWRVVKHVRHSHVVLQSEDSSARITYSFEPGEGATVFTRRLEYKVDKLAVGAFTSDDVNRVMKVQSERAANQLKVLVEKILRVEEIGLE